MSPHEGQKTFEVEESPIEVETSFEDHQQPHDAMAEVLEASESHNLERKKEIIEQLGSVGRYKDSDISKLSVSLFEKALERQERLRILGVEIEKTQDIKSMQYMHPFLYERAVEYKAGLEECGIRMERVSDVLDCYYINDTTFTKLNHLHEAGFALDCTYLRDLRKHTRQDIDQGVINIDHFSRLAPSKPIHTHTFLRTLGMNTSDCTVVLKHKPLFENLGIDWSLVEKRWPLISGFGEVEDRVFEKIPHYMSIYNEVFEKVEMQTFLSFCIFLQNGGVRFLENNPGEEDQRRMVEMYSVLVQTNQITPSIAPDETYKTFSHKLLVYFDSGKTQIPKASYNRPVEEVDRIKKMFRLDEHEPERVIRYTNQKKESHKRKNSGFWMKQASANCYSLGPTNGLRRNVYAKEGLIENIDYDNEKKERKIPLPLDGSGIMETVRKEDLDADKRFVGSLEQYIESLTPTDLEKFFINVALSHEKNQVGDFLKEESMKDSDTYHFFIDKEEIKSFYSEYQEKEGERYESLKRYFKNFQTVNSVDAPLGYKLLDAALLKATKGYGTVDRVADTGGSAYTILETLLGKENWDFKNAVFNKGRQRMYVDGMYLVGALKKLETSQTIMIARIERRDQDSKSPSIESNRFFYQGKIMARGHVYTVTGFDEKIQTVQLENPWDVTNEDFQYDIPLSDFIKIFSSVCVAERKRPQQEFALDADF